MTWASQSKIQQLSAFLLEYEEVFAANSKFVARYFGPLEASKLGLTDSHEYLENALKYLILSGLGDYKGSSVRDYFAMLQDERQKAKWMILLKLPLPISQRIIKCGAAFLRAIRQARVKGKSKRVDRSDDSTKLAIESAQH
jgi:hypothetical protein